MKPIAILIRPLDTRTNQRFDVRVADGGSADAFGIDGFDWAAAITSRPQTTMDLFAPDLTGTVLAARMSVEISLPLIRGLRNPEFIYWGGAPITAQLDGALDGANAIPDFDGYITTPTYDRETGKLQIEAEISLALLDKPLLSKRFSGGGGSGGDPGKRGTLYPAGFGTCYNIEPVWFDEVRNIGMIDGYFNTQQVLGLYEGRSPMGASVADYPTYAALAAAIDNKVVAPGRWATCIAAGLVGLGAPPVKPVGVDAVFGSDRPGAMMRRILQLHALIPLAKVDVAAFAAMDVQVNRPVRYWTGTQRTVQDLVEAIAKSINAAPLVTLQGMVSVARAIPVTNYGTIDLSGASEPRVLNSKRGSTSAPVYEMVARAARPANVLERSEINYDDDLVDLGLYNPLTSYRQGNTVWSRNGSEYLYINVTAGTGHTPPNLPVGQDDGYWAVLQGPTNVSDIVYDVATGSNQCVLSSFAQGLRGFRPGGVAPVETPVGGHSPAATFYRDLNLPGHFGARIVPYAHYTNTLAAGDYLEAFWTPGPWGGDSLASGNGYMLPVKQGDRAYGRCLAAQHRCRFDLYLLIFNKDGGIVGAKQWVGARETGGQNGDPSTFNEIGGIRDIIEPAAAFATLLFRMVGTGGDDPYMFFTEPAMGILPDNQTVLPVYTDGPNDPIADVTALNQAAMNTPDPIVIQADYQGNQTPGQFPIEIGIVRRLGGANVSPSTVFNVGFGGNVQGNINNVAGSPSRGLLTITGGSSGTITVTSAYNEVYLTVQFTISTNYAAAPVSGGSTPPGGGGTGGGGGSTGGGPSTVSTFTPPSTNTAYVIMATLSGVTVGSAGSVMVSASLSFAQQLRRTEGVATNLLVRVTRSVNGGTEAEAATQASQEAAAKYIEGSEPGNPNGGIVQSDPGTLTLSFNDGGIPAGAVVVYRIYGVASPAANGVQNVQGTFAATPN